MKISTRYQDGFTLVEVLIALLIVSIAFSAIMFSVNQNARNEIQLEKKIAANWVAEDIITRAQIGLLKANNGVQVSMNKPWHWQLKMKSTPSPHVQEIEVTIQGQNNNTVSVSTGYIGTNNAR